MSYNNVANAKFQTEPRKRGMFWHLFVEPHSSEVELRGSESMCMSVHCVLERKPQWVCLASLFLLA
jgi:hypothetical protein